jgi:hypothetical protein
MMSAMSQLLDLLGQFFFLLALGNHAFSWIASPRLTGAGFQKLLHSLNAAYVFIAMLCWTIQGINEFYNILFPLLMSCLWLINWRTQKDDWSIFHKASWCLITLFGLSLLVIQSGPSFFLLVTSLFLGLVHYAMVLGHYYLVVPKLSEKPLLVSLQGMWLLMVIKLVFSTIATWDNWNFFETGSMLGESSLFNWLILSMRWLWGYGAFGVLSYFAWRLCKIRSIQSATGVLYIMVFFVFVGELLSLFFALKYRFTL